MDARSPATRRLIARRVVAALLCFFAMAAPAGAEVSLDAPRDLKPALQGGVVSYRGEDGSWHVLGQPFGSQGGVTILDVPHGNYDVKIEKRGWFRVEVWSGRIMVTSVSGGRYELKNAQHSEQWNWLPILSAVLAMGGILALVFVPRVRRARHDAIQARIEADASRLQAAEAAAQALELANIPVPSDYRIGDYRLIELLGDGGMASVFRVVSQAGDSFAMKIPHADCLQDGEFLDRFRREQEITRTLHHPAILRIYDAGTYATEKHADVPYLVMEIVKGRALDDVVRERGALPLAEAVHIIRTAAEALHAAHEHGIIHRDIKPGNMMMTDRQALKLMDFGIARDGRSKTLTQTGTALGTPAYMSPEQVGDSRRVDRRTDLYSLGVVFFELLTGRLPFDDADPLQIIMKHLSEEPPSPRQFDPSIPDEVAQIVLRMLAKEADDRQATAREVADALTPFDKKR